jgi:cellobiose phosphorylase
MLHLMTVRGADAGEASYETDRLRFIGRTGSTAFPLGMEVAGPLSDSAGSVLDPIVAIRHRLMLDPEQSATIDIVSAMAETRGLALSLIDKYQDRHLSDRVFDLAWTHSQVVLRQLNATEADAQLYARLASSVIYANASMRADPSVLIRNHRGQSGLWGYAISGDLPIVLLQIGDAANIDLVRQMVQAHAYWRLKGLAVDLVIWNEDHAGYRQQLQAQIMGLIASGIEASVIDRPGGIFVRPAEQISGEDRILLQSVARAVINGQSRYAGRTARPAWPPRAAGGEAGSAPAPQGRSTFRRRSGAQRSDPVQRPGRLHARRQGICHRSGARTGDAGALGQRAGESGVRDPGFREWRRLYLERECPRIPPHPLAQRSGRRCERRSAVPAR